MSESVPICLSDCRKAETIARILAADFYDAPVCFFPTRLREAASRWIAISDSIHFFLATSQGEDAGYLFVHTLGPELWRTFAKRHPHLFPHLAYTLLRHRLPLFQRGRTTRLSHAQPHAAADRVSQLDLLKTNTPFEWSKPDSTIAYIEMIYVPTRFRGAGVGSAILNRATDALLIRNVRRLEAHIDASNYASIRAFQKAGWHVVQTSTLDLKATFESAAL